MTDEAHVKDYVLELLARRYQRLTPAVLIRAVQDQFPHIRRHYIRQQLKKMINEGLLTYTSHFNTSHLELSVFRPFQVSPRITLCPQGYLTQTIMTKAKVCLTPGAAFGVGDHPTTRLALQALDYAIECLSANRLLEAGRVLDIGTGSGVLAIAAVLLGMPSALAIDTDPLALHEARHNVMLNALDESVRVTDDSLDTVAGENFLLVLANLRMPTLKELVPAIHRLSCPEAFWVFSGFRPQEQSALLAATGNLKRRVYWASSSHDWSSVLLGPQIGILKNPCQYMDQAAIA